MAMMDSVYFKCFHSGLRGKYKKNFEIKKKYLFLLKKRSKLTSIKRADNKRISDNKRLNETTSNTTTIEINGMLSKELN